MQKKATKKQTLSIYFYIYNTTYSYKKIIHTLKFYLMWKNSSQIKLFPYVIMYSIKGVSANSR